jgi:hypothetical protein
MSTLTVTNIVTANSSIPLTLTTGNAAAADIIVNNNEVLMFANSTTNVTINSSSIAIAGVSKVNNLPTSGNQITVTQQLFLSGNVTPTKLAANTSDWNPGTGVYNIRAEANSTTVYYSLFGLTAGLDGQEITITNINATPIIIRNEDSANEDTAVNRFNMPNHIKLDGYMSAQFYYDGTLDRWRLIDSVNIPFDHKYSLTKGFFAGGFISPTSSATSEKITYDTESRSTLSSSSNTLSVARWHLSAAGNADKGFFSGGYTGAAFSLITDKVTVTTEVITAVSGANLSQAREGPGAVGNADKGIFAGGATAVGSTTPVTTADRTIYSTETTAAVSGANLSQARGLLIAVGNADKGFFMGGFVSPASVTTAGRTIYSTETHVAVSGANLSQARRDLAAAGNADKGFVAGGDNPTGLTTTDRATYSTETTAAVSGANLSQARSGAGGAGNSDKGFFAGGITPTPASVVTADRTTYSSETTAAVSGANLGTAKYQLAAV